MTEEVFLIWRSSFCLIATVRTTSIDDRQRVQSARQSKSSSTSPNGLYVLSVFTARVVALRAISSITVAVSDVLREIERMRDREMERESDTKRDMTRERRKRQKGVETDIPVQGLA